MKKILFLTIIGLMVVASFLVTESRVEIDPEKMEVETLLQEYFEALKAKDGKKVASLIHPDEISYFDEIKNLALENSPSFSEAPLQTQFTVLKVRYLFTKEELKSLQGTEFFVKAIERGISEVPKQLDSKVTVKKIIKNDIFKDIYLEDQVIPPSKYPALRLMEDADGNYTIDILYSLQLSGLTIDEIFKNSGLGREDFLSQYLKKSLNISEIPASLWDGPKR